MLLSQFEWKYRDSPTETRLTDRTDSLSFVTPAIFPRAVTVRRMANDVMYTMYAAFPIHYMYNLWCVCVCACVCGIQFRDVQMAYEILSDSEKREMYDRFGMEGVRDGAGINSMPSEYGPGTN